MKKKEIYSEVRNYKASNDFFSKNAPINDNVIRSSCPLSGEFIISFLILCFFFYLLFVELAHLPLEL